MGVDDARIRLDRALPSRGDGARAAGVTAQGPAAAAEGMARSLLVEELGGLVA